VIQERSGRAENVSVATSVPIALVALLSVVLIFVNAIGDIFRDRDS
jgi:hypothetical protein